MPEIDVIEPTATEVDDVPPPREEGGPTDSSIGDGSAAALGTDLPDGWDVVEVHHDGDEVAAEAAVRGAGGDVHGYAGDSLVEAAVPVDAIPAIEGAPHVTYVTAPNVTAPDASQAITGAEVEGVNADDWHVAGMDGAGVKVGIIDYFSGTAWTAATAGGDLGGSPAGTFCRVGGTSCDIWASPTDHGTAVAEVVHEMAPAAQLYIATTTTTADFQAAIDYFVSQGVTIVTQSRTVEYDGPGVGTCPIAEVLDSAVCRGIVYVKSAGNSAGDTTRQGSYWRGSWSDPDGDGWLDFAPGDEELGTTCSFSNGFRWDDFVGDVDDYDVFVYDENGVFKGASENRQSDGAPPIESLNEIPCVGRRPIGIRVRHVAGTGAAGDVFEFMANGTPVEHWQNAYSASGPMADSANPGMVTVGAVDLPNVTSIAPYSSQGPTNDGRTKPDITGVACVQTTYRPCFNGTSAATPVVAGALALARAAGAASTPAGLVSWLEGRATDRGTPGADDVFGAGVLQMLPLGAGAPLASIDALIDRQHLDLLDRAPTTSERTTWRRRLLVATTDDRADLVASLRLTTDNVSHVDPVARLYWAFTGAHPDRTGLLYWVGRKRIGHPLLSIASFLATTSQYGSLYGGTTNTQFVNAVYQNVMQRAADATSLSFWVGQLNGGMPRARVIALLAESAEGKAQLAARVNASVVPTLMLHQTLSVATVAALVAGNMTSEDLAEWAFTNVAYPT